MVKRLIAATIVSLLAIVGFAMPASASTIYGCTDNNLCLYRWTQFNTAGGIWSTTMVHLDSQTNNCIDFGYLVWPNDQSMADNSGSLILNGNFPTHPNAYVDLYDWPNCNGNGEFIRIAINQFTSIPHLSNTPSVYEITGDWDEYHQIHSVRLFGY